MTLLELCQHGATPKQLAGEIENRLQTPQPLGTLRAELLAVACHPMQTQTQIPTSQLNRWFILSKAASDAETAIGAHLVARNSRGIEHEREGDLPRAIAQYELNVTDLFDGTWPYNRLRIIYTRQKRYAEALRVCRTAVQALSHSASITEFQAHVRKLEKRQ